MKSYWMTNQKLLRYGLIWIRPISALYFLTIFPNLRRLRRWWPYVFGRWWMLVFIYLFCWRSNLVKFLLLFVCLSYQITNQVSSDRVTFVMTSSSVLLILEFVQRALFARIPLVHLFVHAKPVITWSAMLVSISMNASMVKETGSNRLILVLIGGKNWIWTHVEPNKHFVR